MNWTRRTAANLAAISMQAGLAPDESERALMIGARMLAHGFDQAELDAMVRHAYVMRDMRHRNPNI